MMTEEEARRAYDAFGLMMSKLFLFHLRDATEHGMSKMVGVTAFAMTLVRAAACDPEWAKEWVEVENVFARLPKNEADQADEDMVSFIGTPRGGGDEYDLPESEAEVPDGGGALHQA